LAVDAKTLIRDDYVQGKTTDNTSAGGSSGQVSE